MNHNSDVIFLPSDEAFTAGCLSLTKGDRFAAL